MKKIILQIYLQEMCKYFKINNLINMEINPFF